MDKESEEKYGLLITRYLSGEASPGETDELKDWLAGSRDNLAYYRQLRNIWNTAEGSLYRDQIDTSTALGKVKGRISPGASHRGIWAAWKNVAAVLLIPLILGNILYFVLRKGPETVLHEPVYNELYAAFGTRSAFRLADGTAVWLNSGSSIRYPDRFTGDERKVFLSGEAYFEVESNPAKPFIVHTASIRVRATGTKFNVLDYPAIDRNEVTLVTGKVEVCSADSAAGHGSTRMEMNQHLTYEKSTGEVRVKIEDTYKYISWKEGKLIFRNEPLTDVAKKISQIFNIDIEIRGKEIENYTFRATFQDESLAEILKLLKLSSPINYTEVKRNPLPDGSFPRKKVIIYPAAKQGE